MSTFWIVYFVSLAVVIIITALVKVFFTYDGDEFNILHIIIFDLIAAIPFVGTFEAFCIVALVFMGCIDGDLEPKYEK